MKLASILSLARFSLAGLVLGLVAPARAAEKPVPQVSISLRGIAAQTIEQGEPWQVVVRLALPRGSKESLELAPGSGTWADALAVELYRATGNIAVARADALGKPDAAAATLDTKRIAGGLWRFSPEKMQAVAPGNYVLRVQLKIDSGGGWTGIVAAREIPLTVLAATSKPSVQRVVNQAQDFLLIDQVQDAAVLVDAVLKNAPREYALLKVRALIAEKAGNPFAAIMCLKGANFSMVRKTVGQPPAEDGEMLERLEKSRKTASANPPAWTWPPVEVLTALSQEAQRFSFVPAMPPDRPTGARNDTAPTVPGDPPPRPVVPSNPVPAAAPSSSALRPPTPTPALTPTAAVGVAPPVLLAPAGPSPGVIVPSTELNDAKIAAEAAGQWAASAVAGSQYGKTQYSPAQATGAPNIRVQGNSPDAWCPANKSNGTDWLELTFAKPVHAAEVRVRQNDAAGAISKIEAMENDGTTHVWWEGSDPYQAPAVREIVWFAVRVPKTDYLVVKVKITLNLAAVPGWKEIDAVQLVGVP